MADYEFENIFYKKELETMPPAELRRYQFDKIKELLEHVYHTSAFFRRRLDDAGAQPDTIRSLEEFAEKAPFMSKADLVEDQKTNPPWGGRLCVPLSEVRHIHQTSGSSGQGQEVYALTDADVRYIGDAIIYHLVSMGCQPGELSAIFWPIATMAGGLSALEGVRMYGMAPLMMGIFDTNVRVKFLQQFNPHHLWTTPAYLLRLTVVLQEMGINPRQRFSNLRAISTATEAFTPTWTGLMEEIWGARHFDCYGTSQVGTLAAFTCYKGTSPNGRRGVYHLLDDLVYTEVLDPQTGEPVGEGEWGEPVITTFCRQASPLLRFRSADRVRVVPASSCDCGRTAMCWEMGSISRYDDMIKIKAQNVWPAAVDEVIFAYPEVDEYNGRVFIDEHSGRERAAVKVEFKKEVNDAGRKQEILQRLGRELKEKTQVSMEVGEVPFGTVQRFDYKVRRWTDEREEGLERVRYLDKKT